MPVAAWMEFPLPSTRMNEAIRPQTSTRPTARYTVRLGKASRGESDWSTALPLAPPRAAETRAAATPATSQVARAAMGRLESRRSTRYQCPSSSPSMVAPRNRAPVTRASAPRAGRPLSSASGQPATSPGTTAAIPAQRAAGARAYSSTCQTSTAAANTPSQSAAIRPVSPAAASSPRPASQARTAQASAVPPASLKNPGRTTPQSGASHSRARPPSAVSYRTTVRTPAGPCTAAIPLCARHRCLGSLACPLGSGPQGREHPIVEQAVGRDRAAPGGGRGATEVGEAAAGLLDDHLGCRQVPELDLRFDGQVGGSLGDQHVAPEVPERPGSPAAASQLKELLAEAVLLPHRRCRAGAEATPTSTRPSRSRAIKVAQTGTPRR